MLRLLFATLAALSGASGAVAPLSPSSAAFERQTWQTENGLPQNTVHDLLQSADGYLWVATEGGVARFDGSRFQLYSTETQSAMQSNDVRSLAQGDSPDEVWAATPGGALCIHGRSARNVGTADGLPSANVLSIFRVGRLIAVTSAGAAAWDGSRFVGIPNVKEPPRDTGAPDLAPDDPLVRAGILCHLHDREGNFWVGTETGGLTVLRRARFTVYGSRQGLPGDSIRCVVQTRDGTLWIGTAENGVARFANGAFTRLTARDGLSSDVIIALGEDPDGNLLVGTPDGLDRIQNGRVSVMTSADGLADDFVRSIATVGGAVYIGTRRGFSEIRGKTIRNYSEADGLGSNLVGAMLPALDGPLWIATSHGLSRFDHGRIQNFSAGIVTALYRDADGRLWVGTQNDSLVSFEDGKFRSFPKSAQLPKTIYGISEDRNGSLWLASNTGIFRVDRRSLVEGSAAAVAYGTSDGLRVNEASGGGHPTVWRDREGTLWFATPRGLAAMTSSQQQLNRVLPPVVIENVSIDDVPLDPSRLASVPPGHNRYSFEYAGLSFSAPQKVRYRYKLEGFDRDWVDAGVSRVASYTNLAPGHYRFHVLARNNDGFWNSEGASIPLNIEPHVYQRAWFLSLCALVLAALVYQLYRLRVRQVAARYDAVLAERNRIAREIHDTLAQGFAGLSVQLEILSRLLGDSSDAARQHLNEARALVRDSLAEARRSIWELRSQSAGTNDLAVELGKLTRPRADDGQPRITLDVQGTFRPLPERIESEIVRIAQESVRNASRHAHAAHIQMTLGFGRKLVTLLVKDDGDGFDPANSPGVADGHYGLDGMRERAGQIGGKLAVESAPGQGTRVLLEVPIR